MSTALLHIDPRGDIPSQIAQILEQTEKTAQEDKTKAIARYYQVLELVKEHKLFIQQYEIHRRLARIYISINQYKECLAQAYHCISLKEKYNLEIDEARLVNLMGVAYKKLGDYPNALDYFQKVIAINNPNVNGMAYSNLAQIYHDTNKHVNAIKYLEKALSAFEKVESQAAIARVLNNLGNIYSDIKDLERSNDYCQRARQIAEDCGAYDVLLVSLVVITNNQLAIKQLNLAEETAAEMRRVLDKWDSKDGEYSFHQLMSKISEQKGEQESAKLHLEKALELGKIHSYYAELKALQDLHSFYKKNNDYKKAHYYLELISKQREWNSKSKAERELARQAVHFETKEKEREIQQLKKESHLKTLLLEKSKEVAKQNEMLEAANQELKQFNYAVSHDLREPLRMINSFTTILEKQLGGELSPEQKELFDFISGGGKKMESMLEDLLKYSTLGTENFEMVDIDLNQSFQEVQNLLKLKISETQAIVSAENLPKVKAYPSYMSQLLQNLINNGIKFQPKDNQPVIKVGYSLEEEYHRISVSDNGIGIAKENLGRVFDLFKRLNPKSEYKGTGIGLAVCQKIVQKHGGKIWLESELGKGTTFFVNLPR